jgi:hypothetical protein
MMSYRLQIHIVNDDPVVLDVDDLPQPGDQFVIGMNPQSREGKRVESILREVNQVIFPWWRITYIQVLPSEGTEEVPTFVRE